jgi:hypothetical protein
MKYTKSSSFGGPWAKASEIASGTKAKIVSETVRSESQFKDKNGNAKMQDVAQIRFQGKEEAFNINLNRATLNGLIEAFGEESVDWTNKVLTVHTEKVVVGGKRVTALYLIPEGFEVRENDEGYIEIARIGSETATPKGIEYPHEEINPDDIPF